MFEWFYWTNIIDAFSKLPKEAIIGVAAAYVVIDIHKRNSEVKIAQANAGVQQAELQIKALELEIKALELKRETS